MNKYARAGAGAAVVWTLAVAAAPYAQIPGIPKETQLNPGGVKPGRGNFVILGCVARETQGSAQVFTITDSRPTPEVRYRLEGDADLLRIHIGHTVEVGGPITPAPAGGQGLPALKVQALTYLATNCVKLK